MSQTRKKRRASSVAVKRAEVAEALQVAEVLEALAGEELAEQRERAETARSQAEQAALIAATQESEARAVAGFQLKRTVESLLFASDRPIEIASIRQYLGRSIDRNDIQDCLDQLVEEYSTRGIVLHDVAGGYQFRTHPASSTWIQKLIAGRPVRLSRAQLDTLAIIAYRQPITRPEIDDIRGVDSGSTLKILLDRNLLRILGKKEEVGRPLLYGTSKEFLEFFNLSELRDLPTLREFHELNDDGLAQVDKLGADIEGVDVGAVASEVAAEREAARRASEAIEAALAEEKRQARESARAERKADKVTSHAVSVENDEATIEELPMAGRDNDKTDAEVGSGEAEQDSDNTRLDVSPAPGRDPDTIIEEDLGDTSTQISAVAPDLTVVDRVAAPETATEIQAIDDNTVLESSSIEHTIPEGTLADIMPVGMDGTESGIDELTIVPTDSSE